MSDVGGREQNHIDETALVADCGKWMPIMPSYWNIRKKQQDLVLGRLAKVSWLIAHRMSFYLACYPGQSMRCCYRHRGGCWGCPAPTWSPSTDQIVEPSQAWKKKKKSCQILSVVVFHCPWRCCCPLLLSIVVVHSYCLLSLFIVIVCCHCPLSLSAVSVRCHCRCG